MTRDEQREAEIIRTIEDWALVEALSKYTLQQIASALGVSRRALQARRQSVRIRAILEQISEEIEIRVLDRREDDIMAVLNACRSIVDDCGENPVHRIAASRVLLEAHKPRDGQQHDVSPLGVVASDRAGLADKIRKAVSAKSPEAVH